MREHSAGIGNIVIPIFAAVGLLFSLDNRRTELLLVGFLHHLAATAGAFDGCADFCLTVGTKPVSHLVALVLDFQVDARPVVIVSTPAIFVEVLIVAVAAQGAHLEVLLHTGLGTTALVATTLPFRLMALLLDVVELVATAAFHIHVQVFDNEKHRLSPFVALLICVTHTYVNRKITC